jgi:hypothetical protein
MPVEVSAALALGLWMAGIVVRLYLPAAWVDGARLRLLLAWSRLRRL